jgi:hypothetical protein
MCSRLVIEVLEGRAYIMMFMNLLHLARVFVIPTYHSTTSLGIQVSKFDCSTRAAGNVGRRFIVRIAKGMEEV